MSDTSSRYRVRANGVAWRQTGDEGVVLDVESSEYFGLSRAAARLWQLLEEGATRDELVAELMRDQVAPLERVEADVDRFLHALTARHLVTVD